MIILGLSGVTGSNDDHFRFSIAMEPGARSQLKVYQSGGNGVFEYKTTSDYIYSVKRFSTLDETLIDLKASESSRVGYPSGVSWVPGSGICPLTNHYGEEALNNPLANRPAYWDGPDTIIPPLTPKNDLSNSQYIKSAIYIPSDHYQSKWSPDYLIEVCNISSPDGTPPFIEVVNNDINTTGVINLFSATQDGCLASFDIRRNYISGNKNPEERREDTRVEKFEPGLSNGTTSLSLLEDWNGIFALNDGCNAGSLFRGGENRDEAFMSAIGTFINENWYGSLRRYLWEDCTGDFMVDISSRDPEILRNMILYQFYYFGASDDILNMGRKMFGAVPPPGENSPQPTYIRWHMGIGGLHYTSSFSRQMTTALSYFPAIGDYRYAHRVASLPPRTAFGYILQNNENLSSFSGFTTIGEEGSPVYY